ncbi:ABC transporter related [Desulfofarcimen acetoxidans DSM 771]|jgi:energy-coupling factor transport system ATP-binding protein|uniref:Energy-coupling factor transporter ATP-binding protein EcfA2 n=1 Tax=Desulfofarcimen acetoxidans (strain ATCC 49208 / DSM 771 / KCTC 5769 / VKM B-1644 / 5575) TaxID=485916 RepID=C8W416_DESAS|nr:energy-coupling factor transporter ATPase [Desulfofarcimen acetoxidans]ACV61270.1 ABC transporter related [Desulfofarcimen acetoxidans DSM 771]
MSIIEFCSVDQIYHAGTSIQKKSLSAVSFNVEQGEMVAVVGATGSGKSTLVQHINGILLPYKGQVLVKGVATSEKKHRRSLWRMVGLVFQYPENQLFEDTVYKDVAFGPRNLKLPNTEVDRRVRYALKKVGLDYEFIKDESPLNLSGGQKRRVAVAGVLAIEPEILVLDEPTAGLEPRVAIDLLRHLKELQLENNTTVLIVTHNLKEVASMVDRVLVLHQAKVLFSGTPRELYSRYYNLPGSGLALPPALELMLGLEKRGKKVRTDVLTIDEAVAEILKACKK